MKCGRTIFQITHMPNFTFTRPMCVGQKITTYVKIRTKLMTGIITHKIMDILRED